MFVKIQKKKKNEKQMKLKKETLACVILHVVNFVGEDCPKKGTAALITANEAVSLYDRKIIT